MKASGALTPAETATLSALVDGLFPEDELGPGAVEIGVVEYLTRAFAGPYREFVPIYRTMLAGLERAAAREHERSFVDLDRALRDSLIARLERGQLADVRDATAGLGGDGAETDIFAIVWQHLREGLFSDPIHGGNRAMLGWRLVGFPGAQYGYTAAEQELDAPIDRGPRSAAELGGDSRGRRE